MSRSIAAAVILASLIVGCGTGSRPSTTTLTSAQSAALHLASSARVVPVDRSAQRSLRLPKNSIGGVPMFQLNLSLYDAPLSGSDSHVNLALLGINVLSNGVATPVVVNSSAVMIDLLDLQATAAQFAASIPVGSYDTLQLVVDPSASNVQQSGTTYPVQFGSVANTTGELIGIDVPATISGTASAATSVTADFNVLESIDISGGLASIEPQIVIATNAATITGTVENGTGVAVSGAAVIVLDQNNNVLNTTVSDADGRFALHALPSGSMSVVVENTYVSDSGTTLNASGNDPQAAPSPVPIPLSAGSTTNIGIITD